MKSNFTFLISFRRKLIAFTFLSMGMYSSFAQVATHLVISQVYGGGGNIGAQYTNDYIELFNPTSSTINMNGWSLQYASASGSAWVINFLSGSIAPYTYYLIQEKAGSGGNGYPLPTPDATGLFDMAVAGAKIALCSSSASLLGACPTGSDIIDFVGYGSAASCFEGSAAASGLTNTTAIFRADSGCIDTDNNSSDFSVTGPSPRNSASPQHTCSPSGIQELLVGEANNMKVFPNPCRDKLWVVSNGLWVSNERLTIEIFDVLGQSVYVTQLETNNSQLETTLDVSQLRKGIYWVQLTDGVKVNRNKLIKE